jgi:hypothetical protein
MDCVCSYASVHLLCPTVEKKAQEKLKKQQEKAQRQKQRQQEAAAAAEAAAAGMAVQGPVGPVKKVKVKALRLKTGMKLRVSSGQLGHWEGPLNLEVVSTGLWWCRLGREVGGYWGYVAFPMS